MPIRGEDGEQGYVRAILGGGISPWDLRAQFVTSCIGQDRN